MLGPVAIPRLPAPVVAAALLVVNLGAAPAVGAVDEPLLRGPHPFRMDNALTISAGYGLGSGFHGLSAGLDYGYQIAGSLWFDLRFDLVDAAGHAPAPLPCIACAEVTTFADVLAGLRFKLQTDIPLVPYGSVAVGPVFLFHQGAPGAVGMALQTAIGAKYFLFDWFGLGAELGLLLGGAVVDEMAGLTPYLRLIDLGIGAEVQF
jgi:hypothetical protein